MYTGSSFEKKYIDINLKTDIANITTYYEPYANVYRTFYQKKYLPQKVADIFTLILRLLLPKLLPGHRQIGSIDRIQTHHFC